MPVHPIIFEPIFKSRVWGGHRLATLLDKRLPLGQDIGESWELCDLESDQSVAVTGLVKGRTLRQIMTDWGTGLLGSAELVDGRFPLLIKFLDAKQALSVQVHPFDERPAATLATARPKHEAWYVIHADPESLIHKGLRTGVDESALRRALEEGEIVSKLLTVPARKGHHHYIPGGTVHALGAGVVVAEVQTPSDTTFRLFDWDRVDPTTGRKRELQVEEGLRCVRFEPPPRDAERQQHVASVWTSITHLVRCESFVMQRVRMVEGVEQPIPYDEMTVWIVLEGRGEIRCAGLGEAVPFTAGDVVLVPAALKDGRVRTLSGAMWLEVSAAVRSSLAGYDRPDPADLLIPPGGGAFVPLNISTRPKST